MVSTSTLNTILVSPNYVISFINSTTPYMQCCDRVQDAHWYVVKLSQFFPTDVSNGQPSKALSTSRQTGRKQQRTGIEFTHQIYCRGRYEKKPMKNRPLWCSQARARRPAVPGSQLRPASEPYQAATKGLVRVVVFIRAVLRTLDPLCLMVRSLLSIFSGLCR